MSISSANKLNLPLSKENDQLGEIDDSYTIDTDHEIEEFEAIINKLNIKVAYPGDIFDFGESPASSIIKLKKLPNKEVKKDFLKYLTEKKKEGIIVGDRWAFLEVGNELHAYGAHIVLKDINKRKTALSELISGLEKEVRGSRVPVYAALFPSLIAISIALMYHFNPSVQNTLNSAFNKAKEPDSIKFLKKQFPTIYKWQNSENPEEKEVAKAVFDESKINLIWQHVSNKSWNAELPENERTSAKTRFILFDLINYHDDIRKQCEKKSLIQGTRFGTICSIYKTSYKSTIFYWKTGHIEKLTNTEEIKAIFQDYDMPISQDDYEHCFDKRIAVAEMDGLQTVSLKIPESKENELPSDWVAAVVENINNTANTRWNSLVLFKLGVPTSVKKKTADLIKPTSNFSGEENYIIRWASLPQDIVTSLGLSNKEYSKEYYISEKVITYSGMFSKILNDDFLDSNGITINTEKARDMLINISASTPPNCNKKEEDERKHASIQDNKDGSYGVGLSTKDPIKASLMHNILNEQTIPELKHEVSELHESNISILRNNEAGGLQERIFIEKSLTDLFKDSESFSVFIGKEDVRKFINVEGGNAGVHDNAYSYDGSDYDSIYITNSLNDLKTDKDKIEITVGGKKAHYIRINSGGRIVPVAEQGE
ncbi:hypothetical protein KKC91_01380 [bacterium]|nr:hypothetical protein [bacterium]